MPSAATLYHLILALSILLYTFTCIKGGNFIEQMSYCKTLKWQTHSFKPKQMQWTFFYEKKFLKWLIFENTHKHSDKTLEKYIEHLSTSLPIINIRLLKSFDKNSHDINEQPILKIIYESN